MIFASSFRKMLTLEQFRNEEMQALYQQYLVSGSVEYVKDYQSMGVVEADKKQPCFIPSCFSTIVCMMEQRMKKKIKEQFEKSISGLIWRKRNEGKYYHSIGKRK